MRIILIIIFSLLLGCNNIKQDKIENEIPEVYFNLKYYQEDAKVLALILNSKAKNFNEIKFVLDKNNINYEFEILEKPKVYPIILNKYQIEFSNDSSLLSVEPIKE